MKKFTIILAVLIAMTISTKAQYSNATLNGAWFLYKTPLSPYNDSLLYIIFDGNGNITDRGGGFGTVTGSNYSVSASGAITGTLVVGDESYSFVGQLSSQDAGTFNQPKSKSTKIKIKLYKKINNSRSTQVPVTPLFFQHRG